MKRIMFVVLALVMVVGVMDAQNSQAARLVKTYTTYLSTSDDTTGYITIPGANLLTASEVGLIASASDSVHANVYVIGDNSQILYTGSVPTYKVVYVDTLIGYANTAYTGATVALTYSKVIPLKSPTLDNLPGCDRFKIGTVFLHASQQGNTAGRTLKWYLYYKK